MSRRGHEIRAQADLRAGLLGRRPLSRVWIAVTITCCITISFSHAIRTRSSTGSIAAASRPPIRPATLRLRGDRPGVAPPGGEALYVLVHTPYLRPHHDWKAMFPRLSADDPRKLKKTAGLDDLEESHPGRSAG